MRLRNIFYTIFVLFNLLQAQKIVLPEKIDDFSDAHSWWEYRTIGCVKEDSHAISNGNGYLFMRLYNPTSREMCDVGISEHQGIYRKQLDWLEAIIRVKVVNPMKQGSRGWGFWRMRVAGRPSSLAWFMEQMGPLTRPRLTWSKAGVISNKGRKETAVAFPENEWHVYRIIRDRRTKTTTFYMDGKLLLKAPVYPTERLSFHCWIDNGIYHRKGVYFAGWQGESALVVDYVVIRTQRPFRLPIQNEMPILYHQIYDEFYDSIAGEPWKVIPFKSHGKNVLVSATARVEAQSPYSPADVLSIQIDQRDRNVLHFGGEHFTGQITTLNQWIPLPEGKHKLQLFATETPFLKNITLLEPDSVLVFRTQFLWQNRQIVLPFHLNSAQTVVFYFTGNALENKGWNHVQAEVRDEKRDEDLMFILDGQPLPQRICGNQVFGNGEIILLKRRLKAGQHQLIIQKEGNAQLFTVFIGTTQ